MDNDPRVAVLKETYRPFLNPDIGIVARTPHAFYWFVANGQKEIVETFLTKIDGQQFKILAERLRDDLYDYELEEVLAIIGGYDEEVFVGFLRLLK